MLVTKNIFFADYLINVCDNHSQFSLVTAKTHHQNTIVSFIFLTLSWPKYLINNNHAILKQSLAVGLCSCHHNTCQLSVLKAYNIKSSFLCVTEEVLSWLTAPYERCLLSATWTRNKLKNTQGNNVTVTLHTCILLSVPTNVYVYIRFIQTLLPLYMCMFTYVLFKHYYLYTFELTECLKQIQWLTHGYWCV